LVTPETIILLFRKTKPERLYRATISIAVSEFRKEIVLVQLTVVGIDPKVNALKAWKDNVPSVPNNNGNKYTYIPSMLTMVDVGYQFRHC
jgi:hypothetical protein